MLFVHITFSTNKNYLIYLNSVLYKIIIKFVFYFSDSIIPTLYSSNYLKYELIKYSFFFFLYINMKST